MRRILFLLIAGLVLLGAAAVTGLALTRADRSISTAIVIDAPVSSVWRVLGDTAKYGEWNPFIRSLTGDIRSGGRIQVTLDVPDQGTTNYDAKLLGLIVDHELRWEYSLPIPRMFVGKHKLIIDAMGSGRTRLRHEEDLSGLLIGPLTASYIEHKREGFEAMNVALKKRVEAGN